MLEGKIQVKKYHEEGLVIFTFIGDFIEPSYISETIGPVLSEFKNIVLDVQRLEYINSSSFGSFFELASKIDQKKTNLHFMNVNKKFKIIFNSLGAKKIFKVITSLNEI